MAKPGRCHVPSFGQIFLSSLHDIWLSAIRTELQSRSGIGFQTTDEHAEDLPCSEVNCFHPFLKLFDRNISKNLIFFISVRTLDARAAYSKVEVARMLKPGRPRPDQIRRKGALAPRVGFGCPRYVAFWVRLLLNLINRHPTRLIIGERLRVIAVARMHPYT
jgi:hypothetical protein